MPNMDEKNLARIRENQRRSRARRKEYLQELERKFRYCEKHGIEASMELQAAARKVADENKRLRELLRQHGVQESEIQEFINSHDGIVPTTPSAVTLENLMVARPCNAEQMPQQETSRRASLTPLSRQDPEPVAGSWSTLAEPMTEEESVFSQSSFIPTDALDWTAPPFNDPTFPLAFNPQCQLSDAEFFCGFGDVNTGCDLPKQ